jgi:parallel beta-helix repeat protein
VRKFRWAAILVFTAAALGQGPEAALRRALAAKTGTVKLPAGVVEISREIVIPPDAHDLDIVGAGTTLKASAAFRGRALLVITGARKIKIQGLALDGNRDQIGRPAGLAPADATWSRFTSNSGIIADGVNGLEIDGVKAANIAGFSVLISAGHVISVHGVQITDSGGLNASGHNNATGGILLEEGTTDFEVTDSRIGNVRGNGMWTRSLARSPKNARGRIAGNEFAMIARNAIEIGEGAEIRVENNRGRGIGYVLEEVDPAAQAAALASAGDVAQSVYRNNQFEEVDGKCLALDGFHDGEVSGNTCVNADTLDHYPFGSFAISLTGAVPRNVRITGNTIDGSVSGGILLTGSGNTVSGNHLLHLNMAHCNERDPIKPGPIKCDAVASEPDLLRSGIYLGAGAAGNSVEANEIVGYGMSRHCVGTAPRISAAANKVANNECADDASVARVYF